MREGDASEVGSPPYDAAFFIFFCVADVWMFFRVGLGTRI